MTFKLQFGFNEQSSTIMCSILFAETVEYYLSNNFTVYVPLIDASIAFGRMCYSKLFVVLETYCIIFILVLKWMYSGTRLNPRLFYYTME